VNQNQQLYHLGNNNFNDNDGDKNNNDNNSDKNNNDNNNNHGIIYLHRYLCIFIYTYKNILICVYI
jgi:hypothetical protein